MSSDAVDAITMSSFTMSSFDVEAPRQEAEALTPWQRPQPSLHMPTPKADPARRARLRAMTAVDAWTVRRTQRPAPRARIPSMLPVCGLCGKRFSNPNALSVHGCPVKGREMHSPPRTESQRKASSLPPLRGVPPAVERRMKVLSQTKVAPAYKSGQVDEETLLLAQAVVCGELTVKDAADIDELRRRPIDYSRFPKI